MLLEPAPFGPSRRETGLLDPTSITDPNRVRPAQLSASPDVSLDQGGKLRALLDASPRLIALVEGPDHIFQFANRAWLKIVEDDVLGRPVHEVLPQADARGLLALLNSVQTGQHVADGNLRHPITVVPVGQDQPIHLDFLCQPMTGPDGAVNGVMLEGSDVTEQLFGDERQRLIINELTHRVKNTSATVLGLARLARGSTTSLDAFLVSLTDRIVAMCRTHDLLTASRSEAVNVKDLLSLELQPYLDPGAASTVTMICQDLTLPAASAVSLSMIVHELLTNALKHGALAAPGGHLRVNCESIGQDAMLRWSETSRHRIGPIGQRGFGSRLIERLAQSLGGQLHLGHRPDGLDLAVTFKVEAIHPPADLRRTPRARPARRDAA